MSDCLVVVSKVKAKVECRVGADAIDGLSRMVGEVITKAEQVAKEEGMKTVQDKHVRAAIQALLNK